MTYKNAVLDYMTKNIGDEWTLQTDILNEVSKLYGFDYEKLRGNTFRSMFHYNYLLDNFQRERKGQKVYWRKGIGNNRLQYEKPDFYKHVLRPLNSCRHIYTLIGSSGICRNYLDNYKLIRVDRNINVDADIYGDIFDIDHKSRSGINLDFEGFLTVNKVDKINEMFDKGNVDMILLTVQNHHTLEKLLSKIKYTITDHRKYKSGWTGLNLISIKRICDNKK